VREGGLLAHLPSLPDKRRKKKKKGEKKRGEKGGEKSLKMDPTPIGRNSNLTGEENEEKKEKGKKGKKNARTHALGGSVFLQ